MATKQPKESGPQPIALFERKRDWQAWLTKNHRTSTGVWLQIAKKGADAQSVSYVEALEVALCFGWIDSQKRTHDEAFFLQKFTPRGPKSIWSRINKDKALALIEAGKMKPAGLAAVESAKRDGRWDAAYESAGKSTVPPDLQAALDGNARAKKFFESLDGRNRYAILFRIQTAKRPDLRKKKIAQFTQMLANREKLYP